MAFFPGTAEDLDGAVFLLRVMIIIVAVSQVRGLFTQVLLTTNEFKVPALGDLLGFFAYATLMVVTSVNAVRPRPASAGRSSHAAGPASTSPGAAGWRCCASTGTPSASSIATC